ncbi:MAG: histidine kinase dimerization/phosphoacceptor domain -containing protein [Gammaproteobacteria bacterium]
MKNATIPIGSTSKYSRRYVAFILVFLSLILIWYGYHHYSDFERHQSDVMMHSVLGASSEITASISEHQRAVKIFAQQHFRQIQYLATNPDDEAKYDAFKKLINTRFPNSFAFTIADSKGIPLLGNFDLLVNEMCQLNIKQFSYSGYHYNIFIHPHPEVYHFDIITSWKIYNTASKQIQKGVFFISFKPVIIARILKHAEVHNHRLLLLKNDIPNLIEISSEGTRIQMKDLNGNFFLTTDQINRIGYKNPVSGTLWDLVDIPNENIFSEYRNDIIIQTIIILFGFIVISFVFLGLARREENIRLKSEKAFEKMKDRLEQALLFSKVGMWEYDLLSKKFIWSRRASEIFHQMAPDTFEDYIEFVPQAEHDSVRQSFEHCIKTGLSHRIEHKVNTDGQNQNWIEITGNIEHDKKKSSNKMIGLIRDITVRKLAEENRIKFEIQQKDTLVREVHHRIKNNLQGVVGLLRQHSKYESIDNVMLDHAVSQLNSVSLVHGIQCDDENQHISVSQLVSVICKATLEIMGINIEPDILSVSNTLYYINEKNAVPVALIVNELIFNAAKHTANVSDKNIHIEISSSNDTVVIKVQNDDAVLPEHFDFIKGKGLGTGLSLIKSLLPREGAELTIQQTKAGVLSTFTLTTPVLINDEDNTNENSTNRKIA